MESSFFTYLAEEEELYVLTSSLTDTSLLTSNVNISCVETEDYLSALSKKIIQRYSTVEDKRKRVKSLTAKLCRDITADVLLDRGKKLFLESALKCLKNELEMLSFAIVQRKASVVKLGSMFLHIHVYYYIRGVHLLARIHTEVIANLRQK